MLSELLNDGSAPTNRDALVFSDHTVTWEQLRNSVYRLQKLQGELEKKRVGLRFGSSETSCALLFLAQGLDVDLFLLDGSLSDQHAMDLARELQLSVVLLPSPTRATASCEVQALPGAAEWSGQGSITILTSGSTGKPKAARHTWESLFRPVRRSTNPDFAPRWLQTYRPNLYAGIQVLAQCFTDCGTLAVPELDWSPDRLVRFVLDSGVQFISATPSYWRRLILLSPRDLLKKMNLVQITLGGEVVDQNILDSLKGLFPNARLIHIYATTELGRCFSVKDGLAGFPATFLEEGTADGVQLKIEDGELFVKSRNAMKCYDRASSSTDLMPTDWFGTGDLVSVNGGRVHFTGRKTEMINVGGHKVYPIEIERMVRGVPGVADVRVYGRASSLSGQLVTCEIVSALPQEAENVKQAVQRMCSVNLPAYQRPRVIKMVPNIELSTAQKTIRSTHP